VDDTARTDPLRPIDVTSRYLGILILAVILAMAVLTTLGALGVAKSQVGLSDPCATVPPGVVTYLTPDADGGVPGVQGLAADSSAAPATLEFCVTEPGAGLRLAYAASSFSTLLVLGGFLVLVRVLVARARSRGLFSSDVARLTGVLGWYVTLAALGAALVQAVADAAVVGNAVPGRLTFDTVQYTWHTPWTALLAGVGVLTIARVMKRAVAMRQDLDATI
jgi:hypothetical protein